MLETLTDLQLGNLLCQLELTRRAWLPLLQAPRRDRGAWSRADLAEPAADLEKRLLKSLHQLGHDWLQSLAGAADDIVSGRLHQAKRPGTSPEEEEDALSYFDIDADERNQPVDKSRLAALLALLLLWRNRHLSIADAAIADNFKRGRQKALSDVKVRQASENADTQKFMADLQARFEGDVDRLKEGLENGTARSYGLRWILENSATIGGAAAYVRRLLDSEGYRSTLLSEHATWWGTQAGMRAGAIDATRSLLKEMGKAFPDHVTVDELSDQEKEILPQFIWAGPDDELTCESCSSMFGEPVFALSADDLPSPESICSFSFNCRHEWVSA